jgi:hypothetical protein
MALDLGKEIGPLPLGAWIAVIAGGLGIAVWSKNSAPTAAAGGGTGPTVVEDIGSPAGVGDGSVGGWLPTNPVTSPTGTPEITTNEQWGNQAINWLIAQGYEPTWCYSAITKALLGGVGDNALSAREYVLWGLALARFGAPPTAVSVPPPGALPPPPGLPPPTDPDAPTPGQPPPPPITLPPDDPDYPPPPVQTIPKHKFDGNRGKSHKCTKTINGVPCGRVQNSNVHFDSIWVPA